ncbi:MAG: DedA family protein [Chloroflexia bacterium]
MSEFVSEWALKIVETLGYFGVFLLIAIENVIPPIPSELILPLAGFSVGQGELTFIGVMIASTTGSVLGALVLYYLGAVIGEARLRQFIRRVEQLPVLRHLVNEGDIDKAQDWFGRYGGAAVFFGRLIPIVRSGISIPAGIARMNLITFIGYSIVGSGTWNGILIVVRLAPRPQLGLGREICQILPVRRDRGGHRRRRLVRLEALGQSGRRPLPVRRLTERARRPAFVRQPQHSPQVPRALTPALGVRLAAMVHLPLPARRTRGVHCVRRRAAERCRAAKGVSIATRA